jgi:tetratricopeptide (TPR) repeat protein
MVDRGPYIVDTLVPGTDIIAHAVQAGLDTAAWMPELRTLAHRVNVGGLQQQALFQQVTNVLRAIAMEHPLMLILDDLQWVDRGSAGLLFHLGRRLQGCRLLILGAYRPEEVRSGAASTTHPLAKLVNEFRRTFGDVWIDLREADANEGRAFVRSLIDTERNRLQNDFRTSLHNHTGGHPLFTIEFLRALQARDALQRSTDGFWVQNGNLDWTAVPARIEAVIAERLSHLNQVERDLLEVASVEGERFTAQVIAQVQGLKERSVLHILNESLRDRHRLVREVDEVKTDDCYLTQFAFGHALFREHLYHRIGDGERRVLHHEVAVALERLYGGTDDRIVSQLAHHFDLAGRTRQAIYYAVRAGQRSRRTYANDEASQYFHRALDLLESIDQDDQLTERDQISRLDALQAMGNLCIDTGKIAEAERYLHQAVAIGRQLELDPQMLAVLYHQLGEALWWQGEYAESLRIGEEGLAMIGDDRTSLGAALMSQRIAAGCAVTGQWTRAWTLTHRTASFIKDLPYSSILKTAFTHIILKCTMSKDVDGVRYWLDHVKRQAQAHGDLLAMGTAHYDTARLMANIGDNQGAIKQTVKARTLWARIGDCKRESWACRELAFRHLIAGNLQAAARCAERELRLIQTVGTRRDIASGRSLTGRIARCRGEIAQAIEAFTDANTRYRAIHSLEGTARTFGLLGRVHLASGNRSEAQLCFKQAMLNVARIESDIALQWQLVTLLVPLTSGLEAALDDLAAFRAWIGHYLDQNPQFDGFLRQWSLQPVAYDLGGDNALEASETVLTDSDWTWEDAFEDCRYVRRGGLEIDAAPTRYLWGMNVSAPRWMRPLPSAGTGSAIQVNCEPARADRPGIGGLLLWKDRRHYLWLERGRFGPEDIAFGGCIANRDRVIGRGRLPGSPVALRLALSDGQVHAFCSSNEGQWFSVGHTAFPLDETVRAGVHALGIDGVIDQLTGMIDQIVYLDVYPEGTAIRFAGFKLWEGEPVGES